MRHVQEVILVEKTVSPQMLFWLPKLVPVKDCPDWRWRVAGMVFANVGRAAAVARDLLKADGEATDRRAMLEKREKDMLEDKVVDRVM